MLIYICDSLRTTTRKQLILGSQSMARKRILGEMGYDFTIVVMFLLLMFLGLIVS